MNSSKVVKAFKVIETWTNIKLNPKASYALFKLNKVINEHIEWRKEEEKKLFEEYDAKIEDNNIKIGDPEKFEEFVRKFNEMGDVEVDVVPITLPFDFGIELSINDISDLEGFIEFEEA